MWVRLDIGHEGAAESRYQFISDVSELTQPMNVGDIHVRIEFSS